ncbi:secreted protein NIS1 [Lindgomyces ingoldianus]|uniref:Secreted protein NIS1 n=1 Tax=Lindgomyces ingoldianus TaxID=673940 RepID=A0ACB6QEJ7_9PLEO|nr:secreted protein NIS1 [Lindgomyces ingoldianus]KAF2465346.1 secreted protein NIS1 [Lindgomyces ingoldianus]
MRISTLVSTLATIALSSARIIGLAAPSTLKPGDPYAFKLLTENYIQSVYDVSVAWGYSAAPGHLQSLGSSVGSAYLGSSVSNTLNNITISASAPSDLGSLAGDSKKVVLSAAVYSLYGASSMPTIANFNVTINVGDSTSSQFTRNNGFTWGTSSDCQ